MITSLVLLSLSFLGGVAHGSVQYRRDFSGTNKTITWGPCSFNTSTNTTTECGNLIVPLDYTLRTSNNKTVNLEILRSPALVKPSKGSIFFNFGGPGIDARHPLAEGALGIHKILGGQFDLIAVDPRGTGNTLTFSCYETEAERTIASLSTPLLFGNASDVAMGRNWANQKINADACKVKRADVGPFVGTAFTARDLLQVVDALGGDKDLNFWGFSYGSILGATVAAMFPDRMGRIVIDGVQNPHEYYHDYDVEWFADNDATFTAFFTECLAQPANCALASQNLSAPALEAKVLDLIDSLKYRPVPFNGTLVDYQLVKSAILQAMYGTTDWPALAVGLNSLLTGNMTAWSAFQHYILPEDGESTFEAQQGIKCGDKIPRASKIEETLPSQEALMKMSRLGGDITTSLQMECAQWGFAAKERYTGDFRVKTKNPMLIVGNTNDPFTPLVSARNVSAGFDGSVLLHHNGSGHCTLGQRSACTFAAISAYFSNGTLPAPGTICQPDAPVFADLSNATAGGDAAAASLRRRWVQ